MRLPEYKNRFLLDVAKNCTSAANTMRSFADDRAEKDVSKDRMSDQRWLIVFSEYAYLYIHLPLRAARSSLPAGLFEDLVRELAELLGFILSTASEGIVPESQSDDALAQYADRFSARMQQYFSCREAVPREGQSPKGTLFWEFAKTVADSAGGPKDISYTTLAETLLVDNATQIDVHEFLSQWYREKCHTNLD